MLFRSPVGIGLMQEAAIASGRPLPSFSPAELARLINAVPVQLTGVAPIARAISKRSIICPGPFQAADSIE